MESCKLSVQLSSTSKEKMRDPRIHNAGEPKHRKDKPMFDHSRNSNWMQGVELHRERRARGEFESDAPQGDDNEHTTPNSTQTSY